MKLEIDELRNRWKHAREEHAGDARSARAVIAAVEERKRYSIYHQYGKIAILATTAAVIVYFLYFLRPFGEPLSRIGTVLMWASPLARVIFELYSIRCAAMIRLTDTTQEAAGNAVRYYGVRKFMNGPVTVSLVVLYMVGFYLLTPELLKYVAAKWVISLDVVFLIGAGLLIWQARKGIAKEMRKVREIVDLRNELGN